MPSCEILYAFQNEREEREYKLLIVFSSKSCQSYTKEQKLGKETRKEKPSSSSLVNRQQKAGECWGV